MDCKAFRETLDLYVDGELAPEANSAAQLHERECSSCRKARAALLNLRRQMKATVAEHKPPAELMNAVRGISEPRWKRFLGISSPRHPSVISGDRTHSIWSKTITMPLPVLALVLIAITLGAWFISRRGERSSPLIPGTQTAPASKLPPRAAGGEVLSFSRFDRGQRASLYKTRR